MVREKRIFSNRRKIKKKLKEEPKRKNISISYKSLGNGTKGSNKIFNVNSYVEYKGYKIVSPYKNMFEILNKNNEAISQMAGINGALNRIDYLTEYK